MNDIIPPNNRPVNQPPTTPERRPEPVAETPAQQPVVSSEVKSRKKSSWLLWLLFVVAVAAAVGAGVWFFQKSTVDDLRSQVNSLEAQVTSLRVTADTQQETATNEETEDTVPAVMSTDDLITGQVSQPDAASDAVVTCRAFPGSLQELWVDYGTTTELDKRTAIITSELELGTEGEYSSYTVSIPASELQTAQQYFYRCSGTQNGESVAAGVASFLAAE